MPTLSPKSFKKQSVLFPISSRISSKSLPKFFPTWYAKLYDKDIEIISKNLPKTSPKTSPKPIQKPLQNRSQNLSKTYPKTSPKPTPQNLGFTYVYIYIYLFIYIYTYIYIPFWSNPPASNAREFLCNPFPKPLPYKGYHTIVKRPSLGKRFPPSAEPPWASSVLDAVADFPMLNGQATMAKQQSSMPKFQSA